ncbi:unnamed protein product [Rotaria sp. Silwood2]|nr:unnamed protein product [Rotaria sp. Silwood2]CAF2635660.1 unnamed protein product [Rotaria sp. Silwood2]CAF2924035.1 unnamed protein product [Rotaria sp. Silwood2]CAF3051712.1 unnamed protein product [Rotaria sp. Silwood2]CAF3915167.1 unnamed protein product [Rotaria sp. Silwood2]
MAPRQFCYSRVAKYGDGNERTGTIRFGETTLGQGAYQVCGASGLVVDWQGAIYYSDASNHRMQKISYFLSTAAVVASTSRSFEPMTKQL